MTNQLFRDYLDNRIPGHETPTMVWVNIMPYLTIELPPQAGLTTRARETDYEATNKAISRASEAMQEMAAATGISAEEIMDLLAKAGAAPKQARIPAYTKPAPTPPWGGNIATQKRRRKL